MGIGHFAVGLALKNAEPRVSLGPLVFAAYLPDFLLGLFVWLGMEQYHVPSDVATRHYLTFDFPYSHGLAATVLWSAVAGLLSYFALRKRRSSAAHDAPSGVVPNAIARTGAWIIAVAVFSHFILDALVHDVGLPLWGGDSPQIGLGLWNHLRMELLLEVAMTVAGLVIYLRCTRMQSSRVQSSRVRSITGRYGMIALLLLLTPIMVAGQATMKAPPPRGGLIASWLITPLVLGALATWLDRKRTHA